MLAAAPEALATALTFLVRARVTPSRPAAATALIAASAVVRPINAVLRLPLDDSRRLAVQANESPRPIS